MRVLTGNTLDFEDTMSGPFSVACDGTTGEESVTFNLPLDFTVSHTVETNGSSTLKLYDPSGDERMVWNSGTFVSCYLFGVGVGGIVTGFSGQFALGRLAGFLAAQGCTHYLNRTYEDGDSYIPDC